MKQETMGWQWHQLDYLQIICTSLQTDNHTSTSSLIFDRMLFLTPSQTVSKHWSSGLKDSDKLNFRHFSRFMKS